MNPLPARRYVRARPRIRLSGALAFRRHALAFRIHRAAPAAIVGPPQPQLRTRSVSAFTRCALALRAAGKSAHARVEL
ncbi:hypothetical protein [Xanthomonas hortorum]|uniref:Uncharacterized protein n=1 Tax=Xanthomonas hortorum pv. hederae TaxID=453603 RepID=A0A9X4BQ89_9XANT|nr:hypothetical protein [Xanthomonas hortorum]MCE4370367.1 hypothetical protein [Xanthomonas hortorum pv. hederae]MDC8637276.1 hypothetical protein [Xanthomonas hortorum pv. hederae]PPU84564.1 hypothetical protein XhhCFBP4925_05225 [Xanthomonas hortorum pv. hederae]PUF01125.1 hypothetical protein C7T87_04775 [Xanthomonas hortorum pv. hederae]